MLGSKKWDFSFGTGMTRGSEVMTWQDDVERNQESASEALLEAFSGIIVTWQDDVERNREGRVELALWLILAWYWFFVM